VITNELYMETIFMFEILIHITAAYNKIKCCHIEFSKIIQIVSVYFIPLFLA